MAQTGSSSRPSITGAGEARTALAVLEGGGDVRSPDTVPGVFDPVATIGAGSTQVLLSLLYRLIRALFGMPTVIARSGLSRDVELLVLRHEK